VAKNSAIENIRKKNLRMNELLNELDNVESIMACKYQVHVDEGTPSRFFLRLNSDHSELRYGPPNRIMSYLNIRNIKDEEVFGIELVKPAE